MRVTTACATTEAEGASPSSSASTHGWRETLTATAATSHRGKNEVSVSQRLSTSQL